MNNVNMETYVTLNPNELGEDLDKIIMEKLNAQYLNKCIKKYGYILKVENFKHNNNIILSRVNQDMYIKCDVEILSIIPEIDQIYYGIVKIVYPQGIFIKLLNIFDTLIPYELLQKQNYKFINGSFINVNNNHTISINNYINVKVIDMNYDKKNFNCIADIIDVDNLLNEIVEEIEEVVSIDDESSAE